MPTYIYTAPSGRRIRVTSDTPPTPEQLEIIFREAGILSDPPAPEPPPSSAPLGEHAAPLTPDAATALADLREQQRTTAGAKAMPQIAGAVGGLAGGIPGAALGGVAGSAIRQSMVPEDRPETAGGQLAAMAQSGLLQGALEGFGTGVARGVRSLARQAYRGFLKPSLARNVVGRADDIVRTALDEALPISSGGVAKANRAIEGLHQHVDQILQNTQGEVDLHQIANQVRGFARQRFNRLGANPEDYAAALRVADRLDNHPSLNLPPGQPPGPLPVSLSEANAAKGRIRPSREAFGVERAAAVETQKFAGRALKEELERQAPAIAPLNSRESRLLDAARAIKHAVEREANQSLLHGAKTMMSGALGAGGLASGVGAPAAAAMTIGSRVLLHPAVASRAAILADRIAAETGVGAASAARLAAYLLAEEPNDGAENAVPPEQ